MSAILVFPGSSHDSRRQAWLTLFLHALFMTPFVYLPHPIRFSPMCFTFTLAMHFYVVYNSQSNTTQCQMEGFDEVLGDGRPITL
jgi:hypothetical protein